jgi:hypothetical protein
MQGRNRKEAYDHRWSFSDVAAHIDAALVLVVPWSSEPRGLAGHTFAVRACSVILSTVPTGRRRRRWTKRTLLAWLATRASCKCATGTRVSALTGSERPAARAAGAPWGVRGGGGGCWANSSRRWHSAIALGGANALRPRRAHAMMRRPGSPSPTRPWLPCRLPLKLLILGGHPQIFCIFLLHQPYPIRLTARKKIWKQFKNKSLFCIF